MSRTLTWVIGCLLLAQAMSTGFETLQTQMAISGSHLAGANFQLMLLMPRSLAKTFSDLHLSQLEIAEAAHVVDAVSAFTEEYKSQGGKIKNLDVVVKHPEALGYVRERGLAFYTKSMTDVSPTEAAPFEVQEEGQGCRHPALQEHPELHPSR